MKNVALIAIVAAVALSACGKEEAKPVPATPAVVAPAPAPAPVEAAKDGAAPVAADAAKDVGKDAKK